MSSHNKNTTWFANRETNAEKEGGRTKMTEHVVNERRKFWKGEKERAEGKMAKAEKLKEKQLQISSSKDSYRKMKKN